MKKSLKTLVAILLIMVFFLGGCGSPPDIITGEVNLLVTRNFGEEIIFHQDIALDGKTSVMELLNQHLDIETEYGGGFVNAINGLTSGYTNTREKEKLDWFYFINGIMTNVGATEYFPTNRDSIWWDYHSWGNIPFTPAVVGAFPQPFLNGYQGKNPGTLILAADGYEELAVSLRKHLKELGVTEIEVEPYQEDLVVNRKKITLVVALWQQLSESNFWRGVQDHRDKTGWFAELHQDVFYSLNEKAERQKVYDRGAGAILSTGMGMGDSTPLWLITAVDMEGLTRAVEVLLQEQDSLSKQFGVLVTDTEIIGLPVQ